MEWTEFIKYLSMGYLSYYGLVVVIDLLNPTPGMTLNGGDDILEFSEAIETEVVEPFSETEANPRPQEISDPRSPDNPEEWIGELGETEDMELFQENINVSTGGVSSMRELFRLAQDQSIAFKKQLVF